MNLKCPICQRESIGDIEQPINYYTCNICKTNIMEKKGSKLTLKKKKRKK